MAGIELRLVERGRDVSFDELVTMVAERAAARLAPMIEEVIHLAVERHVASSSHDRPRAVGVQEAAKLLGISRSTLWRFVQDGHIETVKLGGRTVVRMESIDRALRDGIPKDTAKTPKR